MGFFDRFKKKSGEPKLPENEALTEIFTSISEGDPAAAEEIRLCLNEPRKFAQKYANGFAERCVNIGKAEESELKWLGCTDILIRSGYAQECDYNCELADLVFSVNGLKSVKDVGIEFSEEDFDEDEDITAWCRQIGGMPSNRGIRIGALDIDSDSYVIFAAKPEKIERLKSLAKSAGQRIDLAELL